MENILDINISEAAEIIKSNFDIVDIILFGSYASGKADEFSDIDLIVVLDDNTYSTDYESRLEKRLAISNKLSDLKRRVQIDSLVFTKPEWEKFKDLNSSFSREILQTGISIL